MKFINYVVVLLILLGVTFFSFDTYRTIDAINKQGSGFRMGEEDFRGKDVICIDLKNSRVLNQTLYGKTGCMTEGEIRIKKTAADSAIAKGGFMILTILLSGLTSIWILNHRVSSLK